MSNFLLTELDRELERCGLDFCGCADDCKIYVSSQRAGERIMAGPTAFLWEGLKLTVNATKSAVARPWRRKVPGYSVTAHKESGAIHEAARARVHFNAAPLADAT